LHSYVIIFTLGQYARITENFGDVLKSKDNRNFYRIIVKKSSVSTRESVSLKE